MDYQKVYNQIVDRAKNRTKPDCYTETHHIIPRCMGGSDDSENLVVLTAREHFICHWLLSRIYPEHRGLAYAFFLMCFHKRSYKSRYIPSSHIIAEAKEKISLLGHSEETRKKIGEKSKGRILSEESKKKLSKSIKGHIVSEQTREKIRIKNKNWVPTEEQRKKISEKGRGRIVSEESKKKQSKSMKIKYKDGFSEEHKKNLSLAHKSIPKSDKQKKAVSEKLKGVKKKIITCPHCNKSGGDSQMKRWHFDNCKSKPK